MIFILTILGCLAAQPDKCEPYEMHVDSCEPREMMIQAALWGRDRPDWRVMRLQCEAGDPA
jgi:hypothetical protein